MVIYINTHNMKLTEVKLGKIEEQIEKEQRSVKYDIREFTIEYYVDKYSNGVDVDKNELYVPEYQREFIWTDYRQSRFIESLLLGLPVPLVFVAENQDDGRFEIVDGSQRIRTLNAYVTDQLELIGLKKLTELNNTKFSQLGMARQRKFKNISMRMIVLNDQTTPEIRNEMFDRINTSGVTLMAMEARRGIYKGPFTDFITKLAKTPLFKKLCPVAGYAQDRREEEEMALRFCAFSETYPKFELSNGVNLRRNGVADFLNNYIEIKNAANDQVDMKKKEQDFMLVINFVNKTFPDQGFAKAKGVIGVSKPYFEAIALGALYALREKENLAPVDVSWSVLDKKHPNKFFSILSSRYRTHTPQKLKERIDFAKKNFLEK